MIIEFDNGSLVETLESENNMPTRGHRTSLKIVDDKCNVDFKEILNKLLK